VFDNDVLDDTQVEKLFETYLRKKLNEDLNLIKFYGGENELIE